MTAVGLSVYKMEKGGSEYELLLFVNDIELEFYVTSSRVIPHCLKYDKGDRKWSGGLTALAFNAVEKAKAKKRSAGTSLTGHIRYEWLHWLGYIAYKKQKLFDSDDYNIRLLYYDGSGARWLIETKFPKGTDTGFLANEILHNAVEYRLKMTDELKDKYSEKLKKLLSAPIPVSSDPKNHSAVELPYSFMAPGAKQFRPEN